MKNTPKFTCWECGCDIFDPMPVKIRHFCPSCYERHMNEHEKLVNEYARLKIDIMHEIALRSIEKSDTAVIDDYKDAINAVREMEIISPSSFMSSCEIITAIMLYDAGVFFKLNHKILKYKIDFFLEDDNICLEIDGGMHSNPKIITKDGRRDVEVRNELGNNWETVRIPAKYVEKHPDKLVDCVFRVYEEQKRLRNNNNGVIPYYYSDSVYKYYEDTLNKTNKTKALY